MNASRTALRQICFVCLWVLLGWACPARAQQGGQDTWQWTGRSLAVPSVVARKCITISSSAIYVGTLNASAKCTTVEQYTLAGAFTKTWTAAFTDVDGLASDSAGNVYAFDKGASKVRVFDAGGTQIRSFGSAGSGNGQFSASSGTMVHAIAVDEAQNVYVADWGNRRVLVFDSSGAFKLKFGSQGDLPGQFQSGPAAVAWSPDNYLLVYDSPAAWYHVSLYSPTGSYLKRTPQLADTGSYGEGSTQRAEFGYGGLWVFCMSRDGLLMTGAETGYRVGIAGASRAFQSNTLGLIGYGNFPAYVTTRGGAFDPSGNFWAVRDKAVECLERRMRFDTHKPVKALPQPVILKVSQVPGSTVVDIDYTVTDTDSATVETQMVAFTGGTRSLSSLVLPKTFPSGKAGVLGAGVPTGTPLRVSWDAAADIPGLNFTTLAFEILARDDRDLVGAHYVTIPSDATNPTPLKISNSPVLEADLFDLWLWLLAQGDTRVSLSSAKVALTSTGQAYISGLPPVLSGTSLATTAHDGSATTRQGRQFAYKLINARAITAAEKTRAAAGNFKLGSISDFSIISLVP